MEVPHLRLTWGSEPNWVCDHCGTHFKTSTFRLRLVGDIQHPDIFDRCVELCGPCATLVAEKIRQITNLMNSGETHVRRNATDSNADGVQHGGPLGAEGTPGEGAAGDDLSGHSVDAPEAKTA